MTFVGLYMGALLLLADNIHRVQSFQFVSTMQTGKTRFQKNSLSRVSSCLWSSASEQEVLDPNVCAAFTIQTCSSTACTKKKRILGIDDDLAIYSGLYVRKEEAGATAVNVEESSCLGNCQRAPCVGIEHEDYYGTVSLEGMTDSEFQSTLFHNVATEEDMDRIWSCVENAIRIMANADDNDEEED